MRETKTNYVMMVEHEIVVLRTTQGEESVYALYLRLRRFHWSRIVGVKYRLFGPSRSETVADGTRTITYSEGRFPLADSRYIAGEGHIYLEQYHRE